MVKSELDKLTASTLDQIKERFKKKGKKISNMCEIHRWMNVPTDGRTYVFRVVFMIKMNVGDMCPFV